MLIVYGLKSCDTTRKALRWLKARGVESRFQDVRVTPVDPVVLARWLEELGPETLVDRRSTTWRTLSESARASPLDCENALALLNAHPTLIKRPVIDLGERRIVGFGAAQEMAVTAATPASR